ncbi:outer membrane beta-barrel protein [Steroidobacter sp.]|uniref:outer membrane beta-barrel protein n=1 Tax=Steroidobacter sp. TaxID=1978227 RepID=UPI001A4D8CD7|nr:outer membrane beta-barrel protein [Steroidobacter sp.]MBL8266227.1 outer membrane beta-barrel protein [Steroidobacter sp.]
MMTKTNKTRLLAGVALTCALAAPSAFAEEYRGFYFGVYGGAGSADGKSRSDFDTRFSNAWTQSILTNIMNDLNRDPNRAGNTLLGLTAGTRKASTLDDSPNVWGALVGFRFNKWVGTEIGYVNLGEVKYDFGGNYDYQFNSFDTTTRPNFSSVSPYAVGYRFSSAGPTAAVVGFLPVGRYFEFNAKAGIYLADTRQTVRVTDVELKDNFYHERVDASQTEIFAGVGATWNATENFAVRVEYQRFMDVGDNAKTYEQNIDVINVGILFK